MNAYCVNSSGLELEWWDELDQDPSIKAVLEGNLAISSMNKWTYSDPECSFLGFCPRWTFTHVHRKGMGNYCCSIVHNIIIPQTINTANVQQKVQVAQSCFTLYDPMYSPWNSPGQNTGVGSLSLLQGIFPTQESNQVSCIAGRFFTNWAIREAPMTNREVSK